jgi:hypothetical protein
MLRLTKLLIIFFIVINVSGCAKLWPYKSDFDCPVPKGEKCKSLYEVNQMADRGKFAPNAPIEPENHNNKNKCDSFLCHRENARRK